MNNKISTAEGILGYPFVDKDIIWEALQMAGSGTLRAGQRIFLDGNKRLAILGDVVADKVLCAQWYATGEAKGAWSAARESTLCNANLAQVGRDHGLDRCLNTHPLNPIHNPSVIQVATAVEALLGAVLLDSGNDFTVVEGVMRRLGLVYLSQNALITFAGGISVANGGGA